MALTKNGTVQKIGGEEIPRIGESADLSSSFDYLVPNRTLPFAFLTVTTTIPMNND